MATMEVVASMMWAECLTRTRPGIRLRATELVDD